MSRRLREQAILDIVETEIVANQRALVEHLRRRGIRASQGTVSRDVKRLGLIKRPRASGGYRYAVAETSPRSEQRNRRQLESACEQFLTKIETGESLLVLKTLSGRANAVAIALDECDLPEIAGTLAGDDTILVVAKDGERRRTLRELLEEMVR